MANPIVEWVTGTRRGLARSLALVLASERKLDWRGLTMSQRDSLIDEAEGLIKSFIASKALMQFKHEWREPERRVND